MSTQEKNLVEKIAKLPTALQDKLADKIDGAIMALDMVAAQDKKEDE